jgi:pimeloyl-ACP methyl ester carboxylesterase
MRPPWDGHLLWDAAESVRAAGLGMERRFFGATMAAVDIGSLAVLETRGFSSRMLPTSVGDLHVLEIPGTGKLPPVVVLHGLGSCAADYAGLMAALSRHVRHIVAPDLFGHGLSPAPAAGMHVELLARGLEEGLRDVLQEPAVLLGNSMGGLEAVRLATRMPELVRGLFLASPGGAPVSDADLASLLATFAIGSRFCRSLPGSRACAAAGAGVWCSRPDGVAGTARTSRECDTRRYVDRQRVAIGFVSDVPVLGCSGWCPASLPTRLLPAPPACANEVFLTGALRPCPASGRPRRVCQIRSALSPQSAAHTR